jgi:hypothetical protein
MDAKVAALTDPRFTACEPLAQALIGAFLDVDEDPADTTILRNMLDHYES